LEPDDRVAPGGDRLMKVGDDVVPPVRVGYLDGDIGVRGRPTQEGIPDGPTDPEDPKVPAFCPVPEGLHPHAAVSVKETRPSGGRAMGSKAGGQ